MSIDEKNLNISHILGIDYGKSNVGLALADSETKMAFAYETLKNDKNLMDNLKEIINKENASKIVVGIPSYSTEGSVEKEAKKLGEFIENNLKIEVFYQNEMFTTKIAQRNLIEKGMKGVNKFDDNESARIILQEWLDNRK
jgi:putative Holliday junction resolvase